MNEAELRHALREAIGEPRASSTFAPRVRSRVLTPVRPRHSWMLTAAGVAIAILLIGGIGALNVLHRALPALTIPGSNSGSQPTPMVSPIPPRLPMADVNAAGLTYAEKFIMPLSISHTTNGRTDISLIGAYADSVRTVLFFHENGMAALPNIRLSDQNGWLNYSGTPYAAAPGDYYFILYAGPHSSPKGTASLTATVSVSDLQDWTFSLKIPVHPATRLVSGGTFVWGSWQVALQRVEATPATVHLVATLSGAPADQLSDNGTNTIKLLDASGKEVPVNAFSSSLPIAGQPDAATFEIQWIRPVTDGIYTIEFDGPGTTHAVRISLRPPAPWPPPS